MSTHPIFRTEALRARQSSPLGGVMLAHPLPFSVLTWLAALSAALVVGVMVLGQYTKKLPVTGQLVPDRGLAKVYPRQTGVLVARRVGEGQAVHRGDVLFDISDALRSEQGDTHELVAAQIRARRAALREERDALRRLQLEERAQQERRISALQEQVRQLDAQLATQEAQLGLARQEQQRYRDLVARAYLARDALTQKDGAVLEQQGKLQALTRERSNAVADLASARTELAALAYRQTQQLDQLERELASAEQDAAERDASHRQRLVAPADGTVVSLNAEPGQRVDPDHPLLAIVPTGSRLLAQLYVPSRVVGFVHPGTTVTLRYRTYPYEIFGLTRATVRSVSTSALPARELDPGVAAGAPDEPLFRVLVELPAQTLAVQGRRFPLQSGMLVDADMLVERKPLYRWILDPLYGAVRNL